MIQLELFASQQERLCADPNGSVCIDDQIDKVINLGDRKTGLSIELAKHENRWMWSASINTPWSFCGYKVGPKWNKFADTPYKALVEAIDEIKERAKKCKGGEKVIKLLKQLNFDVLGNLVLEAA